MKLNQRHFGKSNIIQCESKFVELRVIKWILNDVGEVIELELPINLFFTSHSNDVAFDKLFNLCL